MTLVAIQHGWLIITKSQRKFEDTIQMNSHEYLPYKTQKFCIETGFQVSRISLINNSIPPRNHCRFNRSMILKGSWGTRWGSRFSTIPCQNSHLKWIWYRSFWNDISSKVNILCPKVLRSQSWRASRGSQESWNPVNSGITGIFKDTMFIGVLGAPRLLGLRAYTHFSIISCNSSNFLKTCSVRNNLIDIKLKN